MKTYLSVVWTCRLWNYEPNASWTGQIGVKTEKIWPTEGSGNFVNSWKRILNLIQRNYVFKRRKRIQGICHGLWVLIQKSVGPL